MPSGRSEAAPVIPALALLMAFWGYIDAVNMAVAPHVAAGFALSDSTIAAAFGGCSAGALASLPLARAADRHGRRHVLLLCLAVLAPLALATALAPSLAVFVVAQLPVYAIKGVLMALIPVMVTELMPIGRRATGQAWVGFGGTVGAGLALGVVAATAGFAGRWRYAWAIPALGLVALPLLRRVLPESALFERARASGEAGQSRARELLEPELRVRTLGVVAVGALYPFATTGAQFWVIYHPVRNLGVETWIATLLVITGGSLSTAGYALAARLCDRWGRKPTFVLGSLLFVGAAVAFYRVPADAAPHPGWLLGLCFGLMSLGASASLVAMRAASTELFPTRLRGTVSGVLAVAASAAVVTVSFSIALLAHSLGGIAPAASLVAGALVLAALVFVVALPETPKAAT